MPSLPPVRIITYLWEAFGAYWVIAAIGVKRVRLRESRWLRLLQLLVLVGTLWMVFQLDLRGLSHRFLPESLMLTDVGILITVLGLALAVWARVHLGRNWSGTVTIKKDHELIRTGPYSRLRHPIYSGVLLAMAGTTLALGRTRNLLALIIVLLWFWFKARREEAFLAREFGAAWDEHKQHAGFLLPKVS